MKIEKIIILLQEKEFKQYNEFVPEIMNQFNELNIDIWANDSKLIMLKEYRTKNSLLEWEKEEQVYIASILDFVPNKYINNLYFFMVLNFSSDEIDLRLEINRIEKNELTCKKYIVKDNHDLNRIPFLMNLELENDVFSFDEKFKERIKEFDIRNDEVEEKKLNIESIMSVYFNNYWDNKQTFEVKIEQFVKEGD